MVDINLIREAFIENNKRSESAKLSLNEIAKQVGCSKSSVYKFFKEFKEENSTEKDSSNRVLCHCASGISRSISICVAWLMHSQKLSAHDALAKIKAARAIAEPNPGFMEQLQKFQK